MGARLYGEALRKRLQSDMERYLSCAGCADLGILMELRMKLEILKGSGFDCFEVLRDRKGRELPVKLIRTEKGRLLACSDEKGRSFFARSYRGLARKVRGSVADTALKPVWVRAAGGEGAGGTDHPERVRWPVNMVTGEYDEIQAGTERVRVC